jgi:hypothetical protein
MIQFRQGTLTPAHSATPREMCSPDGYHLPVSFHFLASFRQIALSFGAVSG